HEYANASGCSKTGFSVPVVMAVLSSAWEITKLQVRAGIHANHNVHGAHAQRHDGSHHTKITNSSRR
ncbi:hypothetical protein CEXT_399211, partial [Caerostris extrusa]